MSDGMLRDWWCAGDCMKAVNESYTRPIEMLSDSSFDEPAARIPIHLLTFNGALFVSVTAKDKES
jgi:hypothetical protein